MPKTTKTLDSSIADLGNRLFREFHEALCQLNLIQTTRTACHPAPVQARGKSVPTFNGPWVGKSRFMVRLCKQGLQPEKVNDRKTMLPQPTPQRLLVVTAEVRLQCPRESSKAYCSDVTWRCDMCSRGWGSPCAQKLCSCTGRVPAAGAMMCPSMAPTEFNQDRCIPVGQLPKRKYSLPTRKGAGPQ